MHPEDVTSPRAVGAPSTARRTRRPLATAAVALLALAIVSLIGALACSRQYDPVDSARKQGKTPADFPEVADDVFHDMDGGVALTTEEIKGRNTWMLWTADNNEFWDWMARYGFGTTDLLKMLDSRKRGQRFRDMGLMNDPGCRAATAPDENGMWLDERVQQEPAGVDPAIYGRPSGVLGLRLFPNPDFNEAARKQWNAERFYSDPNYYNNRKLVRPYRVGMACAFCHVGPNPMSPPADPENPKLENLSTYIGSQYFRIASVFGNGMGEDSFVYQILNSIPRGALDTSFLATDNLNNPSNMNAIFSVAARLSVATDEDMAGGTLDIPDEKPRMAVPHILKDGADSVGLLGALSRVFVNIGEFHEEWLRDHNAIVGGKPQRPFTVERARRNSVFWLATETRVVNLAKFFLKAAQPMHLEDAPGGRAYLSHDAAVMARGRAVFADHCASCHSSKRPPAGIDSRSPEGKAWFEAEVGKPDFRDDNFLSDDQRHSITVLKTNAARALATNATRGHVWDNFSSETYKSKPSVGDIEWYDPFDQSTHTFHAPGGGPGYYRTPSLVSMWATAPFFHNNALGIYTGDPSVAGRMTAFDDAIEKLLWPEKRLNEGSIWRTSAESWIKIPAPYLPRLLQPLAENGFLDIGPIPAGTPVNLLANANLTVEDPKQIPQLLRVARRAKNDLLRIKLEHLDAEQSRELLKKLVPDLYSISKCPDFVEDRGHTFGADLPDRDKRALIEFLKTL